MRLRGFSAAAAAADAAAADADADADVDDDGDGGDGGGTVCHAAVRALTAVPSPYHNFDAWSFY